MCHSKNDHEKEIWDTPYKKIKTIFMEIYK